MNFRFKNRKWFGGINGNTACITFIFPLKFAKSTYAYS